MFGAIKDNHSMLKYKEVIMTNVRCMILISFPKRMNLI